MLSAVHTWTLTVIAAASGIAMLWVYGRFSDPERIQLARRKMRANLYAFRLFIDEPALIFRAQKQLLLWNARYLGLMLRPSLVIFIPVLILLTQLEAIYGSRPLLAGEAAIVTAQFESSADLHATAPSLTGRGIVVETPAVRIADQHQACWRVRAVSNSTGSIVMSCSRRRHQQDGASRIGTALHFGAPGSFPVRLAALSRRSAAPSCGRTLDRRILSGCLTRHSRFSC